MFQTDGDHYSFVHNLSISKRVLAVRWGVSTLLKFVRSVFEWSAAGWN